MEEIIGSKTAIKILKVLFRHPSQEFKEISLIKSAKTGKGAASNSINNLIKEKIIVGKRVGKTKVIKLNLNNEIALLLKTSFDHKRLNELPKDILASIMMLKNKIEKDIFLMVVFGSYIAGTYNQDSDIDILIVTKKEINEKRKRIEELFGKKINLHIYNSEEITKKEHFTTNILLNGIIIHGYDLAFKLIKNKEEENNKKIEYLLERCKSALRNYIKKDYEAADYIIKNTIEQLIFLLLSIKNINYTSKKDADESIKKEPEGKIIEKIGKLAKKQKIEKLKRFLIELYINPF